MDTVRAFSINLLTYLIVMYSTLRYLDGEHASADRASVQLDECDDEANVRTVLQLRSHPSIPAAVSPTFT